MASQLQAVIDFTSTGCSPEELRQFVACYNGDYARILRILRKGCLGNRFWLLDESENFLLLTELDEHGEPIMKNAAPKDIEIYLSGSQGYLANEDNWRPYTGEQHWTEYCGITHRCVSFCYMVNIPGLASEKRENMIDWDHHTKNGIRLMLDSGAFMFRNYFEKGTFDATKQKQLQQIVEKYIEFYHKYEANIDFAATLDVFRNSRFIKKITDVIRKKYGVTLMPVYHGDDDPKYFEHYVKEGYPLVGLQLGLPGYTAKRRMTLYQECFELAHKHGTRIHGFGVTDMNMLFRLPYDTVDSTTWLREAVHGKILVPHPVRKHQLITLGVGSVRYDPAKRQEFLENIRPHLQHHKLDGLVPDEAIKNLIPGRLIFNACVFGKFRDIFASQLNSRGNKITHRTLV